MSVFLISQDHVLAVLFVLCTDDVLLEDEVVIRFCNSNSKYFIKLFLFGFGFCETKKLNFAYNLTKDLSCKPLIKSSMKTVVLLPPNRMSIPYFQEKFLCVFKSQTDGL